MSDDSDSILTADAVSDDEMVLVAYLDGELSQEDRALLEKRLTDEPVLREQLARLEASWQCLDVLDTEPLDKELIETTLESVLLSALESINEHQKVRRTRRWWYGGIVGVLLVFVALGSFKIGSGLAPDQTPHLRTAFPLIENLSMFLLVVDDAPEFLQQLTEQKVFQVSETQLHGDLKSFALPLPLTNDRLKAEIARLQEENVSLYQQLYSNDQQFGKSPAERQEKLLHFFQAVNRSPNRIAMLNTLYLYYGWCVHLPGAERLELKRSPTVDAKIVVIRDRLVKQSSPVKKPDTRDGTDDEVRIFGKILDGLSDEELEELLNMTPQEAMAILREKTNQ